VPLHARLRCYLPSTSAILLIVAIAYIALHSTASHSFAGLGLATEIVIGFGLAGLATGTIVISAVSIRRRRAAAGACHACSHPCRGAMVPSPEIDARRWPHRSLSQDVLPLTVIQSKHLQTNHGGARGAEVTVARESVRPIEKRSGPDRSRATVTPARPAPHYRVASR
jgi:hypothetical protein